MSKRTCSACQLTRINRIVCHEAGCPEEWRDYDRECKECGQRFQPEERRQDLCSEECAESYYG